jgi:hypothetical protein
MIERSLSGPSPLGDGASGYEPQPEPRRAANPAWRAQIEGLRQHANI